MQQNRCKYSHPYYNFETQTEEIFYCPMNSIQAGSFCEFHDQSYLNEITKPVVISLFEAQVDEAISKSKELFCIGYILPAINLEGKTFSKHVYFTEGRFIENANFTNTEFGCKADFSKCEFRDNVSFTGAVFNSDVDFSQSVILGSIVTFQNVTYNGKANFKAAIFNNALFTMSKFNEVLFIGSVFNGDTNFWNSSFNDDCDFNQVTFKDKVNFANAKFKRANFEFVTFTNFANFRRVSFENPKKVLFNGNLSCVSFLETDITRITIGNNTVFWDHKSDKHKGIRKLKAKLSRNNNYKIIDEIILEKKDEPDLDLESVMDVYRNLRDNYDYQLRYDVAGEFFVREMEIKRKYRRNKPDSMIKTLHKNVVLQRISILGIYHLIAQYGHSYYRPIFTAIPILTLFTVYFLTRGFSIDVLFSNGMSIESLKEALARSLSAFFPFYTFNKYNTTADFILRIILLPISGSFFITLKRKLERKLRH